MPKASIASHRDEITRYFRPLPDPKEQTLARTMIVAGLVGLAAGGILLIGRLAPGFLGLVLMILAAIALLRGWSKDESYKEAYRAATPKPADAVVDRALQLSLHGVAQRGLARLELTPEDLELESASWDPVARNRSGGDVDDERLAREPLTMFGPVPSSSAVIGRDGVWRFAQYAVLIICPTDYHLALYRCHIDLRVPGFHQEETHEYHYSDVVAVSTAITRATDVTRPIDLGADSADAAYRPSLARTVVHEFQLVVSSGDRSSIVFDISDQEHPDRRAILPRHSTDQVVRAVRRMLRDKKSGLQNA